MVITKEMPAAQIFEEFPQTEPVFRKYGLFALSCGLLRQTVGRWTSLETCCRLLRVNLIELLHALNRALVEPEHWSAPTKALDCVIAIHDSDTVSDILKRHPQTLDVFHEYGIDACCGGNYPIRIAAHAQGVELLELKLALLRRIRSS